MSYTKQGTRVGSAAKLLLGLLVAAITVLTHAGGATAQGSAAGKYFAIAHMTNTSRAVDWAVGQGANAIEADLQFDATGKLWRFYHGGVCDCACSSGSGSVCSPLRGSCEAAASAISLLRHMAGRRQLALIIVDSKIDDDMKPSVMRKAGQNVIKALNTEVFGKGYKGMVIVGAAKLTASNYIGAAIKQAASSRYNRRIFFSFDQESSKVNNVLGELADLGTKNRAFGTGISACVPGSYYSAIRLANQNRSRGTHGMSYIWTVDKESTITKYLEAGAQGIMTNRPARALSIMKAKGLALAKPGQLLPVATSRPTAGLAVGARCNVDKDCTNGACARATAAKNTAKRCCVSSQTTRFAGFDYCKQMSKGSVCWSDAMCASGNCKGNRSGLRRGKCS
ncbi:MAG: hypothetical protein AAF441_08420 [Pseudomonadota bacterium]